MRCMTCLSCCCATSTHMPLQRKMSRDQRTSSVKRAPEPSTLRAALRERTEQKLRTQRAQQRHRLLDSSRSEENYFALQCVGNAFGLNVDDPAVMDSLFQMEEDIQAELRYQAWYEEAHSLAATNTCCSNYMTIPCDEEGGIGGGVPPPDLDWEEYYYSLLDNAPA